MQVTATTAALSQFYGAGKTTANAAQKQEEKPEETFGKTIDGIPVMKIKPQPNWVRYTIKLPYEERERHVIIKPEPNRCFTLSISTVVNYDRETGLPLAPASLIPCKLLKTENGYEITSKFHFYNTNFEEESNKSILRSVLDPLSKAEEELEYKNMIDAALKSLR